MVASQMSMNSNAFVLGAKAVMHGKLYVGISCRGVGSGIRHFSVHTYGRDVDRAIRNTGKFQE